jgi:hypothetical protein
MKEDRSKFVWTGKPHNFLGLAINFTRYILTEEKIITRRGFLNMKEDEILIYRVVDKRMELPITQRIFGCGTIYLRAKDSDTPEKEFKCVKKPRELSAILDRLIENAKLKYRVVGRDMYGTLGNVSESADDFDFAAGDIDGPDGDE